MRRLMVRGVGFAVLAVACQSDPSGPVTTLASTVGNGQTALVGYPTNVRPGVRVTDVARNPTPNLSIAFAVTGGGGSITGPTTIVTNSNGVAQVGGWVVGATAGTNTITATVPGVANPITLTVTGVQPSFHIIIQNIGPALSQAVQTAFDSAVARWQRIIYVSLPPVLFQDSANDCGQGSPAVPPTTIDGVMIQVRFDSIDGPGKILGQSSPCFLRNAPDIRTVLGMMTFDTADVAGLVTSGHLNEVILHEMGHVLGFGILWDPGLAGCLKLPADSIIHQDAYYSCAQARAEFDSIGGTNYTGGNKVPLENCLGITSCGGGTINSHWRESVFFNELMTGYLNNGTPNPLSVLTVASMEDLGYTVNYAAAQPYSRTFTSPPSGIAAFSAARNGIDLGDDIAHVPIRQVDGSGKVVRVVSP